ncbi:MAG: hypothetical protein Fur0022_28810 [Anaerolineales bacterium]
MTEFPPLQESALVIWGCTFMGLVLVTLVLQITPGIRMHRQEGCLGMLYALHGTHVLLTGWRRVDEFNMRPLMIAYSACTALLLLFFCGTAIFIAITGQLE